MLEARTNSTTGIRAYNSFVNDTTMCQDATHSAHSPDIWVFYLAVVNGLIFLPARQNVSLMNCDDYCVLR